VPEGDTVLVAATRLRRALAGERLIRSDFRVPAIATTDLSGQVVDEVVARGKHLLFRTDAALTVHTHFRMDGRWDLIRPSAGLGGRAHEIRCILTTERWVAVGRRLPVVDVLPTADEARVVGHLGPDVLGDDWDPAEVLRRLLAQPERPIGEALIDQRVMAGPGNVYKSEVCFLRGVNPWTSVGAVRDLAGVLDMTKRVMEANRAIGAQVTTGDTRPGRARWVYGRRGEPCRRCGTPVLRGEQGPGAEERVTYWCPSCQPASVPAPGPPPATAGRSSAPSPSDRTGER
jgi:formamidopyrimidine-DNA glycosylase